MTAVEREDKGWCVLELMGHRKLAGYVSDDAGLLRIDVYLPDEEYEAEPEPVAKPIATQWYDASAVYCITASTREMCLALTRTHQPAPVGHWELPPAPRSGDEIADADLAADDEGQGW